MASEADAIDIVGETPDITSDPAGTESIVTSFLQAIASGDADAAAALFAEDIDWYVGGNAALPWTGPRKHRSEVAPYFRALWEHLAIGKSTSVVHQLVISGADAVAFATFKHTAVSTGLAFETPVALHLRVAMGAIVMLQLYEDTWVVSDAFFPPVSASATHQIS